MLELIILEEFIPLLEEKSYLKDSPMKLNGRLGPGIKVASTGINV